MNNIDDYIVIILREVSLNNYHEIWFCRIVNLVVEKKKKIKEKKKKQKIYADRRDLTCLIRQNIYPFISLRRSRHFIWRLENLGLVIYSSLIIPNRNFTKMRELSVLSMKSINVTHSIIFFIFSPGTFHFLIHFLTLFFCSISSRHFSLCFFFHYLLYLSLTFSLYFSLYFPFCCQLKSYLY